MPRELPARAHGNVYWITGLSGAGKTTLGVLLADRLRQQDGQVVLLDGDVIREVLGGRSGHTLDERRQLAGQYGAMCRMISNQGVDVVCATISMFQEVRDWNREHLTRYCEVYVKVPLDELIRRDQKGLYSRALKGETENVMGVNASFEEPLQPDILVENDGSRPVEVVFEELWKSIQRGAENEDELGLHRTGRGVPAEAAVL